MSKLQRWALGLLAVSAMLIAITLLFYTIAHAEPTMDQVYQTARSGDLIDADHMMREVLRNHPNSAKAHYSYAQILTQEGYKQQARDELSTAERIMPGLPFASPQAVWRLEHQLNLPTQQNVRPNTAQAVSSGHVLLWVLLALSGLGVILLFFWWINDSNRRWYSIYHQSAPPAPNPADCYIPPLTSSYTPCAHGTRGCITKHSTPTYNPEPVVHEHTTVIHDNSGGGFVEGAIIGSMMGGNRGSETIINNNNGPAPATSAPSSEPSQQGASSSGSDLGGNDFGVDQGDATSKDSWNDNSSSDSSSSASSWDDNSSSSSDSSSSDSGGFDEPSSGGNDDSSSGGGWDN